jgi:hypothetical protein
VQQAGQIAGIFRSRERTGEMRVGAAPPHGHAQAQGVDIGADRMGEQGRFPAIPSLKLMQHGQEVV